MTNEERFAATAESGGMKPTIRLRWVEAGRNCHKASMTACGIGPLMNLQQYWQDEAGAGEWRDIKEEG